MCPSSARNLRRPLTVVALAGLTHLALGLVLDGPRLHAVVYVGMGAAVSFAGVALLRRAGQLTGAARRSWGCIGLATLSWSGGQLVYGALLLGGGSVAFPSVADIGFLATVPLLMAGTLMHPAVTASGVSLVRSALDGLIVATALLLLTLITGVGPAAGNGQYPASAMVGVAYPLSDVIVLGIVLIAWSRLRPGRRASMGLVLVALGCFVIADGAFVWGSAAATYQAGSVYDTGWLVGFLLLWVAARAAGSDRATDTTTGSPQGATVLRRVVTVMPYAAVVIAMSVGGTQYFRGQLVIRSEITSTALVLIAAMIIRQSVSVLDASAAARELARGEEYFRSIVQGSLDVTTILDADLVVRWQSPSVGALFGVDERATVGRPLREIVHRDDHEAFDRAMREVLDGTGVRPGSASVRVRVRDAERVWRHVETSFANHLENPAIGGIVLHTRDITERWALEVRLQEMAFTDALTELPNRRLFLDRLEQSRHRLAAAGEVFTVLAVDLDGFKAVNDLHGHGAGDALLSAVGIRLRDAVREVDTVARLGGDEFAVLVRGGADEGLRLGERLVETVAAPYALDEVTAHVSVSVGVAEAHRGDDAAVVLRNADLALRHAKQTGKKHVEVYEPALHQGALERVAIEHDLAGAVERGEIRLAFQPIFDLSRGVVVGAEALMRWRHGTRGEVSPGEFIPVAEESGQIVDLGRWALHEASRQLAVWDAAGYKLQMGVNVSTRQLRGSAERGWPLRDEVAAACAASGIAPDRLVLEITESAFLGSFDTALAELAALKALGVHIALDDFGTGYSSLSYLRRLPVDILKIDREFVSGMTTEDHVAALAELVVRLGKRLGMEIVAEGVETAEEAAGVLAIGCVLGQGFHLGRPSSPAEFDELLAARVPPVVAGTETAVPGVTL